VDGAKRMKKIWLSGMALLAVSMAAPRVSG
jgi:hypothetical protein